ncbi:hypothetical protein N7326_01320 [Corynebacterium sp. ES2794-CONJ1]|uniref:hypothetical protein n=1 Tax=unclassified Corynebacterium TaxID=2624378 RepID=UPI00216756A5|nr:MULTISPECIES: hypothetical protein [unclassified Corynebacterium]MCS4489163.1 hypothetical protein [Corynebacterium sp. ES2775-CONJ]MCS4490977.1 hypothetical protein [Corynebacterium sp. ES2715-CONJ3]MCS4531143.1 hypothetical protein [Corynebacterium sp. ES2730-CONJ]MCU9518510.1 hypothetical protein [Corynebacterium sp. ES2794-CONJ1]
MASDLILIPPSPAIIPGIGRGDEQGALLYQRARAKLTELVTGKAASTRIVYRKCRRDFTRHTGSLQAWAPTSYRVSSGHYLPEIIARHLLPYEEASITHTSESIGPLCDGEVIILMLDGSAGMTERAPLSLLPQSSASDRWCLDLLQGRNFRRISYNFLLEAGVENPDLWLELANYRQEFLKSELIHVDSSLGVARYVAHINIRVDTALH